MGAWRTLTGGNSRWDGDTPKPSKSQGAKDLVGFRSSSRANHEAKKQVEDARKERRKDKRAAKQAEKKGFWS